MWRTWELWELLEAAKATRAIRKERLKELVHAFHTSNPKALLDSLEDRPAADGWMGLAEQLGDKSAASRMKSQAMAERFLREENGRRHK